MPYIATINNNTPQTVDFVEVKVSQRKENKKTTKSKTQTVISEPTFSEEVLEASKVLKMTPQEIAEAAEEEKMTPEDYAFIMMLSKKINHNIAKRMDAYLGSK